MSSYTISMRLHSIFSRYMPENADNYPVEPGTTLREVIHELGIPEDTHRWLLVFLNNRLVTDLAVPLEDRDELKVFIALAGG